MQKIVSEQWKKACAGKIKHTSLISVDYSLKLQEEITGEKMDFYTCPFCGEYHLKKMKKK